MFKVLALIALFASVASAQDSGAQGESAAAPEPYAYAYQTDSHQASEQRAPDGTVTGFYTLSDADGRERRVEYTADASGFHAKVATNEVGTKSENSADVEVSASPPTEAQFVYQSPPVQQFQYANKQQQVVYQQQPRVISTVSSPPTTTTVSQSRYVQQPPVSYQGVSYGYYPGYQNSGYGYTTTGVANQGVAAYGVQGGNYNYHLPAQYYSNVQGARYSSYQQPATYTVGNSRYVSQNVRTVPVGSSYTYSSGPVPVGNSYSYSSGAVPVGNSYSYSSETVPVGNSYSYSSGTVPVGNSYSYSSGSAPVGGSYTYSSGSVPGSSSQTTRTVVSKSSSTGLGSGNLLLLQKK